MIKLTAKPFLSRTGVPARQLYLSGEMPDLTFYCYKIAPHDIRTMTDYYNRLTASTSTEQETPEGKENAPSVRMSGRTMVAGAFARIIIWYL